VPWLRWFSPQRSGFDPEPVHVEFCVGQTGTATGFSPNTSGFTCSCHSISTVHVVSFTGPDRPWGPLSVLNNGYRICFPGVQRPGHGVDHPPTSSAEIKESRLILPPPLPPTVSLGLWPVTT